MLWRPASFGTQSAKGSVFSPKADLLHDLAMAAERQGRIADAFRFEEEFLRAPRDLPLSEREANELPGRPVRLRAAHQGTSAGPPANALGRALACRTVRPGVEHSEAAAVGAAIPRIAVVARVVDADVVWIFAGSAGEAAARLLDHADAEAVDCIPAGAERIVSAYLSAVTH